MQNGVSQIYQQHLPFGARYYDSDLSVWLSVEPMNDDYPSTSPYMYVHGNSLALIDPDGTSDDWFMNEKTGEVHYNSRLGKNDASQIDKNYVWLGKNDMFGFTEDQMRAKASNPHEFIAEKADYTGTYIHTKENNEQVSYDEAHFGGKNAKKFMRAMDYDKKSQIANMVLTATTQLYPNINSWEPKTSFSETLKYTYAPSGATKTHKIKGYWSKSYQEPVGLF